MTILEAPPITLRELDERVEAGGLRVRLLYTPLDPGIALLEVYESFESEHPEHQFQVPAEKAREAFLHPYAYAP